MQSPSNLSFSDLPEPCSYEGHVFEDGEDWPLSRCAKCVCRNGAVQCFTAQCQPLFCNQVRKTASEWIFLRDLTSLYKDLEESLLRLCQAGLRSLGTRSKGCFAFLVLLETTANTFFLFFSWEMCKKKSRGRELTEPLNLCVGLKSR